MLWLGRVRAGGAVVCWGDNTQRQLGTPGLDPTNQPWTVGPVSTDAGACSAAPGAPASEVCGNGIDEDCDGFVDDGC